jgi:hypothetical protein
VVVVAGRIWLRFSLLQFVFVAVLVLGTMVTLVVPWSAACHCDLRGKKRETNFYTVVAL